MRALIGPGPEVDVAQAEVVAVEGERTGLGPRPDDQIVRLVEALMRKIGVDTGGMVFRADAAHEAGDDPALRQDVEHRELFGYVNRVVHQRQRTAKDRDLDRLGALDQRAGDQVRRRHQAVCGLVMLVDADRIEAEFLGIDERIDVARIFLRTLDRVVELVRQYHPGRTVLCRLSEVERPVRHEMESDELHGATPSRKSRTWPATSGACSTCGRCPQLSIITRRASRRRSHHNAALAGGMILSSSPQTISDGNLMRCSHFSRSGLNQRGCQPSFATVKRFFSIKSICASSGVSARMRSAKVWS